MPPRSAQTGRAVPDRGAAWGATRPVGGQGKTRACAPRGFARELSNRVNAPERPVAPGSLLPSPPCPGEGVDSAALVTRFYEPLYRFALGLTQQAAGAADLVQQTFYLWALRGHQLREASRVQGWLYTTLRREFLREVRRRDDAAGVEFDDSLVGVPACEPRGATAADGAAALVALRLVAEPFRTPLLLFYLEERSYAEIAHALAIPPGTVMSRLSRGRRELRVALLSGGNRSGGARAKAAVRQVG